MAKRRGFSQRTGLILAGGALALSLVAGAAGYVFFGPASSAPGGAAGLRSVTPLEAKGLIESRADLQLVDCRTPEEYRQGALPGSRLIPFWEFTKGNYDLSREKPILLVCAVGGRSLAVGQLLAARGYGEVYNLKGGLEAWIGQRVPIARR